MAEKARATVPVTKLKIEVILGFDGPENIENDSDPTLTLQLIACTGFQCISV